MKPLKVEKVKPNVIDSVAGCMNRRFITIYRTSAGKKIDLCKECAKDLYAKLGEIFNPKEETTKQEHINEKTATKELKCQYCGRECKSELGLISHEKACKEKGEN